MNQETFDQIFLEKELISAPEYLKEGQEVGITYHTESESYLACDLPAYVTLEITYTEPGERGNTATNVMKDATVETGANVKVPLFISEGDLIKVDTRSGEYSERVKA